MLLITQTNRNTHETLSSSSRTGPAPPRPESPIQDSEPEHAAEGRKRLTELERQFSGWLEPNKPCSSATKDPESSAPTTHQPAPVINWFPLRAPDRVTWSGGLFTTTRRRNRSSFSHRLIHNYSHTLWRRPAVAMETTGGPRAAAEGSLCSNREKKNRKISKMCRFLSRKRV